MREHSTSVPCTCMVGQCCKLGWGWGRALQQCERSLCVARERGRYSGRGRGQGHRERERDRKRGDRENTQVTGWNEPHDF